MKKGFQKGNNFNIGRKASEKTKEKIKKAIKKSWANGRVWSSNPEKTKQKISKYNIGKKVTAITKQKQSEKQKGCNNSFYGKKHTKQAKKKMSHFKEKNGMYGRCNAGQANSMYNKKHTESAKKKNSEWQIAHPNKKFSNTIIEQKTATELERRGFIRDEDFFQNFGIKGIKNVDFYLPKLNVVIECDGCFYHACHQCGFIKYHQRMLDRDKIQTHSLKLAGYSVFRFWGHDINTSVSYCIDMIPLHI